MNSLRSQNCGQITPLTSRRDILRQTACGFGWLAFSSLAHAAGEKPLAARQPHFPAKAKRVLFLCMRGGPSHVDTFDYKPKLIADSGKPGKRTGTQLLGPKWKFAQRGSRGLWVSDLLPHLARQSDDLCVIRSMQTDLPAHPQAFIKLHTGTAQFIRPSIGAWTLYGLGSANENLPGFITITPPSGFGGATNYGSSFLPAIYQATRIGSDNRPIASAQVANLAPKLQADAQRAELDLVQSFNRQKLARDGVNSEVEGVIESFELAFRMQSQMPAVMDLNKESQATRTLYGLDDKESEDFGRKLLLARRSLEAGVRFVEVTHGNWDHHFNLWNSLESSCAAIDKPIAGLLADLKQRGMLEDTLVIWSGEFGRTPHAEGVDGRDHNVAAFSMWMAGGGVKRGLAYGQSDDYGYEAVENKVQIHDLHATILHLLGLDHQKLTYQYAGRDFRLTDVKGRVVKDILA